MNFEDKSYFLEKFEKMKDKIEEGEKIHPVDFEILRAYKKQYQASSESSSTDFLEEKLKVVIENLFENICKNQNKTTISEEALEIFRVERKVSTNLNTKALSNTQIPGLPQFKEMLNLYSISGRSATGSEQDIEIIINPQNRKLLDRLFTEPELKELELIKIQPVNSAIQSTVASKQDPIAKQVESQLDEKDNKELAASNKREKSNATPKKQIKQPTKTEGYSKPLRPIVQENNEDKEKEEAEEINNIVKQMGKYLKNINKIIKDDTVTMIKTEDQFVRANDTTKLASKKLDVFNKSEKLGIIKMIVLLISVLITFLIAVVVLRFFPRFI